MKIVRSAAELSKTLRELQRQGFGIGFVPTMGALHSGHLNIARRARKENGLTVMSIFVNPTQFGPGEDFERYPRDLEKDAALVQKEGFDFLFAPQMSEIYPEGFSTFVEETQISKGLCGVFRPGHFRGVTTVVFRLFQIIHPDKAYFGEKDGQQLRLIEKMVSDFELPIEVVPCPTVRESDGLALSSRNAYLSEEERHLAPQIYTSLSKAKKAFDHGERKAQTLLQITKEQLSQFPEIQIQYVELRRWSDFQEVETVSDKSILAFAGFLGKTRLIDNVSLIPA